MVRGKETLIFFSSKSALISSNGTAAEELGSVDEIGGINEAIAHAAELSELIGYKVEYYGQQTSFGERLRVGLLLLVVCSFTILIGRTS